MNSHCPTHRQCDACSWASRPVRTYLGAAVRGETLGVWDGLNEHFTALPADMAAEMGCPDCYAGTCHNVRSARMYHP